MTSRRRGARVAFAILCGAAPACSAVLGLQPPPPEDTVAGGTDATAADVAVTDAPAQDRASSEGAAAADAALEAATSPTHCADIEGVDDSGATYSPLSAVDDDGGSTAWSAFATSLLPHPSAFSGGVFDGRYVYLAGRATTQARYDTTGTFEDVGSWTEYLVSALGIQGGFEGAVFDGRYVYYVPYLSGTVHESVAARYDTTGPFTAAASWTTFDLSTLVPDAGSPVAGFWGGSFDGRYVYFVPHNDGLPFGRIVRYDTTAPDGGAAAVSALPANDAGMTDAGMTDAGMTSAFDDPSQWQSFDLSSLGPQVIGYLGAVFDGTSLYLVPSANDALDSVIHGGDNSIAVRLHTAGDFTAASAFSTIDLTTVNGLLTGFMGGAFDGQYVYLAPRAFGIVPRFDTAANFEAISAWSTYDVTRQFAADAATPDFAGAAFDGRFVYFVPAGSGFTSLTRYDTSSTFGADCAWSTLDLARISPGDAGPGTYVGAVFDGQFLYLVPAGVFPVLRFEAKTPPAQPMLPAYYGSFL